MRKSLIFAILLLSPVNLFPQDDSRPWERLGLSITEWKLIQENDMPMSKVESLLRDGIGISEYFGKPWDTLGITENKWIQYRRSGLTNYDIRQQALEAAGDPSMKPTPREFNTFQELDRSGQTREQFAGFFMPGYVQVRRRHAGRGGVMIGLAAGSIIGTMAWSIGEKRFSPIPLLVVLIPDMCWSYIDYKVDNRKKTR